MTEPSLIERAVTMDSHQPNAIEPAPVPQGLKEYEECIRELRRRLEAAGKVS